MTKNNLLLCLIILLLTSCKKQPVANFDYDNMSQTSSKHNSKEIIHLGDKVQFFLLTIDGETYSWDFGDGTKSAELSPSHVYTKPGTYTVKLTATNGNKNASVSKSITIGTLNYFSYSTSSSSGDNEIPILQTYTFTSSGQKYIYIKAGLYGGTSDYFELGIPLNCIVGNSYVSSPLIEIDYYWKQLSYQYSSQNSPSYYTFKADENDASHIKGTFTNISVFTLTGGYSAQFYKVNFNVGIP